MKQYDSDYLRGVFFILAATFVWGLGYPLWKLLAVEFPPLLLTFLSFSFASVVVFFLNGLSIKSLKEKFFLSPGMLFLLALSGGLCGTGLIFYALANIDSGVAAMLEKLQVIVTILVARIYLGERLDSKKLPYMFLALVLSYVISVPDPLSPHLSNATVLGIAAAMGAAFFYGLNTVMSRHLVLLGFTPGEMTFYRMGLGAVLIIPALFFHQEIPLVITEASVGSWLLLLVASLLSLVLAFDLFFRGLKDVPASISTFLELLTPLIALALGFVFLSESISITQAMAVPLFMAVLYKISLKSV